MPPSPAIDQTCAVTSELRVPRNFLTDANHRSRIGPTSVSEKPTAGREQTADQSMRDNYHLLKPRHSQDVTFGHQPCASNRVGGLCQPLGRDAFNVRHQVFAVAAKQTLSEVLRWLTIKDLTA
jgi:hypothetical protein